MEDGVLGKHYVTLGGRDRRDMYNGATVSEDEFIHLSTDAGQTTICGKVPKEFMLTYSDIDITCPDCVKMLITKNPVTVEQYCNDSVGDSY